MRWLNELEEQSEQSIRTVQSAAVWSCLVARSDCRSEWYGRIWRKEGENDPRQSTRVMTADSNLSYAIFHRAR